MFRDPEIRAVFQDAFIICGVIFLSTLTRNWSFLALATYGVVVAAEQRLGKVVCVFFLIAFMPAVNLMLLPRYGHYAMISRFSMLLITFALILATKRQGGRHRIPLGMLFPYIVVAFFSSMFGYFPLVSHLKILNFLLFIIGIYLGTQNINRRTEDTMEIRHMILAIILLLTYGSLLTLPFPSIAYFTSLHNIMLEQGTSYSDSFFSEVLGMNLFTGVSSHSQTLGPTLACASGWLLCDMWFVKKRLAPFHLALLAPIPFLCYMTRSRIALFVLIISLTTTTLFCMPKAKVPQKTKIAFYMLSILSAMFIIVFAAMLEIKSKSFTKWVRKTDDVSDERSLSEAITYSRQGAIYLNLRDFKRNPMFGSGFQVSDDMRQRYAEGKVSLFSASIEKGILPLMVLGETGIIGAGAFTIFLFSFYGVCRRKHYRAMATLFTLFLATNMAEASFFAPSGIGGVLWTLTVVGGFVIDMQQFVETPVPPCQPFDYEMINDQDSEMESGDEEDTDFFSEDISFCGPAFKWSEEC